MTILDNLKAASLQARKAKDTAVSALLSTLISDVQMVGKNDGNREPTEGEVIAIIKKYIANTNETKKHLIDSVNTSHLEQCVKDEALLTSFLPSQLTVEQLETAIENAIVTIENATAKDMGKVMKLLKALYEGKYDAKTASELIKSKLNAV